MSREVFLSAAGGYNVYPGEVTVTHRPEHSDRPFQIRLGNIILLTTFEVLDSLVTQGGFAREHYLREQTKCESCRGTGMAGHPESPDSCQVCRGTGIGGA
jgi:hypothetical protein